MCVHVSCWFCVLREFFKLFDKKTLINHILLYVLICKMIQNQQIEYPATWGASFAGSSQSFVSF